MLVSWAKIGPKTSFLTEDHLLEDCYPTVSISCACGKQSAIRDFKIQYGEALVRQTCERLLPVTSLVVVQASFPAVGRLSGTANTPS